MNTKEIKPKRIRGFVFVLILCAMIGKAQWVTIPDANFATYLQNQIPAAMSGNQLNTSSSLVSSTHSISVYGAGIADLTGVQYFTSLTYLTCQNNSLTTLPPLPGTLQTLICSGNSMSTLPSLPGTLTYLDCSSNQLGVLPALPGSLAHLACRFTGLTSLPPFPHSLTYLDCSQNNITALPSFPSSLTYIDCSGNGNGLTSLPSLPPNLLTLYCGSNGLFSIPSLPNTLIELNCPNDYGLTTLPALPNSLVYLECQYNYLTSISSFPNSIKYMNIFYSYKLTSFPAWPSSLLTLDCSCSYSITSLPALPGSLQYLDCSFTPHLTSLPALPNSLTHLGCGGDSISCFPYFPSGITVIALLPNSKFNCLPNHIPAMDAATMAYPLCSSGNSHNCSPAGLPEIQKQETKVNLYPNPNNGVFRIENSIEGEQIVNVVDLNGNIVKNFTFTGETEMSCSSLASGLYFVVVTDLHSSFTTRIKMLVL